MEFKIDNEVPLPAPRGRSSIYPLDEMEVGHSFVIDSPRVQSLRETIAQRKRRGGAARFTVRKVGDEYRCWRTE